MNKGTVIGRVGKLNVEFGSQTLSSRSEMILINDFPDRLELPALLDDELSLKQRRRGYCESEAILGLVHNQIVGGTCLGDLEVLRGDPGTLQLLGAASLLAPATAGELLRKFGIGQIRNLQRVTWMLQQQVRSRQTTHECTIDIDSSIYEQASKGKQGSTMSYNGEVGYHLIFAFWDEEDELLFSHLRRGSAHSESKATWFLRETLWRVPDAARKKLRADSAFYCRAVIGLCEDQQITFGITALESLIDLGR